MERSILVFIICVISFTLLCISRSDDVIGSADQAHFRVGSGVYDITGPSAERGMLGYADLKQVTYGIYTRLRSRAFVIEEPVSNKLAALVVVDLGLMFDSVKAEVLHKLEKEFPGKYSEANVMISATHTHSGPGGFSNHDVYNLTTLGYDEKNFAVITEGIFQSIRKAHANLALGSIRFIEGQLSGASGNRSLPAYLANEDWRSFEFDIDPAFTLLRFTEDHEVGLGEDIGILNWFAVHATCMSKKNRYISSDNKGRAAELFERDMATDYNAQKTFVAAFANANEGDSSPHFGEILSKDNHRNNNNDDDGFIHEFEFTEWNGSMQYRKARFLIEQEGVLLSPKLDYRTVWVKMPDYAVAPQFARGKQERLCRAAMGYSFAAGAEDGPSDVPGIYEGMKQGEATLPAPLEGVLTLLRLALGASGEGGECHYPKPILISAGNDNPDLIPETIPLQLIVLGRLAIAGVPAELTTMAGRRLKKLLIDELKPMGVDAAVIAGLANDYSGYVTTFEEYSAQHYEGASTLYGPNTLGGYLQIFSAIAKSIRDGTKLVISPVPPPRERPLYDFQPGVVFDDKRIWERFGGVLDQPNEHYINGDIVSAKFRSGHTKNGMGILNSYLEVQQKKADKWVTIARDTDSETFFKWEREKSPDCLACSSITVNWRTSSDTAPGRYRIRHHGLWKSGWDGKLRKYRGTSNEFEVGN